MIGLYRDSALTLRVSAISPKRFLLPLKGGTKSTTLYLGDPYTATTTAVANSGASTLVVNQTFEFLASGHAVVSGQTIAYTGITSTSLTGVTGITSTINVGSVVQPSKVWNTAGHVTLVPSGGDLGNGVLVSLNNGSGSFNFPGTPLILSQTQVSAGVSNALTVGVQVQVLAGAAQELQNWSVISGNFYARDSSSVTAPANGENGTTARMYGYVYRQDQALKQWARILPVTRQIPSSSPGFVIGDYRWKDETNSNAVALLPTAWDQDVNAIGPEKFTTGIGHGDDLEPLDIESSNSSIYARIKAGHYFTGPERNFLPATPQLEFFPANSGSLSFTLSQLPQQTYPLYVGTYQLDSQGYYSHGTEYRYQATGFDVSSTAPAYQYTLNWKTGAVVLNQPLPKTLVFLGTLSGLANDYFDMAMYPVAHVNRVFIDRGAGSQPVACPSANITFNQSLGTIQLTDPAGLGPTIPTGLKGEAVFADCDPAVAVLYSSGTATDRLITTDLNPANSGISAGHLYLQHRRQKTNSILVSVDKPSIDIPPTPQLATRIQTTGGSNTLKYLFGGTVTTNGGRYSANVLIKNQGLATVTVNTQFTSQTVPVGTTKNISLQFIGNGTLNAQIRFETDLSTSNLDIVVFNPSLTLNGTSLISADSQLFTNNWSTFGGAVATVSQLQPVPTIVPLLGQTAYGPVYFENDYALISATCYSKVPNEKVPGARLQVIVDPTNFSGLINYQDPLSKTIQVVTGGDGVANLIFTPTSGFGVWIPNQAAAGTITSTSLGGLKTVTLSNDTLVLPATVPIGQIRSPLEGWLVTTYFVYNNNPLFGMVGADPNQGQIAFQTTGTAGAVGYKTNGMRDAWRSGSLLFFPINAYDVNGNAYTSASFNGLVKYIQFATSIPHGATVGAFFVSYLQRITLQLALVGSNITSNTVILQMQVPSLIVENPWLIIQDSTQGRLNQYRLGWVKPVTTTPTRTL